MTDTTEPHTFWAGEPYAQTLDSVVTALSSKESLVAVTGERGVGKTALARELRDTLLNNQDSVLYFDNPPTSNAQLQQQCREQQKELAQFAFMVALEKWLLQLNQYNRRCVLIIDNAHLLNAEVITSVRIMNNLQSATHRLLQVVLLGEPGLFKVLSQAKSGGLNQRISMQCQLPSMSAGQIKQMLFDLFSLTMEPGALKQLFSLSKGKPSVVVTLGKILAQQGAGSVNKSQLSQAIAMDPNISLLRNKQRLKWLTPVVALPLIAAVTWSLLNLPSSEDVTLENRIASQKASLETPTDIERQQPDMPKYHEPAETTQPKEQNKITTQEPLQSAQTDTLAEQNETDTQTQNGVEKQPSELIVQAQTPQAQNEAGKLPVESHTQPQQEQTAQKASLQTTQAQRAESTPSETTPPATDEASLQQILRTALASWIDAWQRKDIGTYLDAYTDDFRPTNGATHQQWRDQRTERILAIDWMRLSLGDMEIQDQKAQSLTLRVWLNYASPGYQDQTLKELEMVLQSGRWLIASERNKEVRRGDLILKGED